jgi:hypothetical protein
MSSYPPPLEYVPIFNANLFKNNSDMLTYAQAAKLFLSKIGVDTAIGTITIENDLIVKGQILVPNGTKSVPSYSFNNNKTSGMYLNFAGTDMRFCVNGNDCFGARNQPDYGIRFYGANIAGYVPTSLCYYEEYTGTTTFTGGSYTTATITFRITLIGNTVNFYMSRWPVSYTSTTVHTASSNNAAAFPARFRPLGFVGFPVLGYIGGTRDFVLFYTDTNVNPGILSFKLESADLPANTTIQMAEVCATWQIN